jgi:hypothetical protein
MRTLTLLLSLLLVGCATLPSSSPTATLAPTPSLTATPALDLPPNARLLDGPDIRDGNIRFFLDPRLGARLIVFDQTLTSPSGQAAHSTLFSLTPDEECKDWCIVVYPVHEFEQAFGMFVFPPSGYGGGAAVIFHAQESAVDFQNGNGVRALETFGQMAYFVNNNSLKYAFRGVTTDGQFAVYVQIPARSERLSALPPTLTVTDPTNDILTYNQHAVDTLNSLPPSDFSPPLDLLDALVASIQVGDE